MHVRKVERNPGYKPLQEGSAVSQEINLKDTHDQSERYDTIL